MSASLQMAKCWHHISMATRFFQQQGASFHGDCSAGSSALEMLQLGGRKGFERPFGKEKVVSATKDGPITSHEALLRFKTTAAAETQTRITKKEKYDGRLQQSHERHPVRTARRWICNGSAHEAFRKSCGS
jgi:hypothetical protein